MGLLAQEGLPIDPKSIIVSIKNITSSVFEAYLKCPTKCFLVAHGEGGSGNLYADWVRTETESYKNSGLARLSQGFARDEIATGLTGEIDAKTIKWRLAVDFTAQALRIDTGIHAVEKISSPGRGKSAVFIPIRFIFRNKLNADDKLLLAFDAFALSSVLGRTLDTGKIIHGDDRTISSVKLVGLKARVGKSIEKIVALLATATPPELILRKHCTECGHQSLCRQKAVEKDDLSLLSGLTEKERKKSNNEGIFTVTQLSYTFRPRRRPRRLRNKRERHHHSLRALAIREKKIHVVGNPELIIEGTPVYLDVEGLPDRDIYYLIGVRIEGGESTIQHSPWADNAEDERRIWCDFLAILTAVDNPVLIHYGRFETTFLKRMHDRYGGPPEDSTAAKALKKAPVNLLTVIFSQVYFPTYTNGLKDVAETMGFHWSDAKASGAQSVVWRYTWEQSRNPTAKQNLVRYNVEDCEALEIVTNALVEITRPRGRPGVDVSVADNVVSVESMKRQWPFSFGNKTHWIVRNRSASFTSCGTSTKKS